MKLSDNEISRYARQIALSDIGEQGQIKFKAASVLIIGAGGLGMPAAQYLAGAGIGTLTLVDGDTVSLSNLHRQPFYSENDIGLYKAGVLSSKIKGLNSDIKVMAIAEFINPGNAADIIELADIVLDCTDNLKSRYLINDACVILDKAFISASIYKNEGQIGVFNYRGSGTYRCIYPEGEKAEIPSCAELGVLGILPGILGLMQANEVFKILLGRGDLLINKMLHTSALNGSIFSIRYKRNNDKVDALIRDGLNSEMMDDFTLNKAQLDSIKFDEWIWLDVREMHETPELIHDIIRQIPLSDIARGNINLNEESKVICFCQTGIRSVTATEFLKKRGMNKVLAYTGDISDLQQHQFFNKKTVVDGK